jgi:hypothetical protein
MYCLETFGGEQLVLDLMSVGNASMVVIGILLLAWFAKVIDERNEDEE